MALLVVSVASAQRYTVLSGDLKNISGIKSYQVKFDYVGMKVDDFDSEEGYVKHKAENRRKHNDSIKAVRFEERWYAAKKEYWQPAYINFFNARFKKYDIRILEDPGIPYTMTVKTLWIYPGYDIVHKELAKITAIISVTETANPQNVLVSIEFDKTVALEQNNVGEYVLAERIAAAYERLVRNFAIQLIRFLK